MRRPAVQSHFLGAIVLEQETQAPGRIPEYTVIDGQQRLTTLQLLISGAEQSCRDVGQAEDAGDPGRPHSSNNPERRRATSFSRSGRPTSTERPSRPS